MSLLRLTPDDSPSCEMELKHISYARSLVLTYNSKVPHQLQIQSAEFVQIAISIYHASQFYPDWGTNGTDFHLYDILYNWPRRSGSVTQIRSSNLSAFGKAVSSIGFEYVGQFKNGKMTGYGEMFGPTGAVWKGEFFDGNLVGKGVKTSANGCVCEGIFDGWDTWEGTRTKLGKQIERGRFVEGALQE